MDAFKNGEVFKHPNFLQTLFQANEKTTITHYREIVIKERESIRKFWNNATFSFLLDKFEERY
jgi:hypothetical protein